MTRVIVYSSSLVFFLGATAATFYSILADNWLIWHSSYARQNDFVKIIGLHHSWTSTSNTWTQFPPPGECGDDKTYDGQFCGMWRTTGFVMNFAALLELATLVAFLVIIAGGRQKREGGWRIVVGLMALVGISQCFAMSSVSYLYDYDNQFSIPGWGLDWGFTWCTFSWAVSILLAVGISLSAYLLPSEGGYELIPSERTVF